MAVPMTEYHPAPDTDITVRRKLGALLKTERVRVGLTQSEAVALVGKAQSTIAKVENGQTSVSRQDLAALIEGYEVHDDAMKAKIWALWERACSPARLRDEQRIGTPPWFLKPLETEQAAKAIWSWTGERIHGLLQSECYMVAQLNGEGRGPEMTPLFRQRKNRQKVFGEAGKSFDFIFSESALDRLCAQTHRSHVISDQLRHMISLAELDNVTIRFLPYHRGSYAELDFVILRPFGGKDDCAYSERVDGVSWATKRTMPIYRQAWSAKESTAATPEDTLQELRRRLERAAPEGLEVG
ncbi:helix-turn-helix domain-containing protein [Amycolatopsis sp. cg5]|uniref:helix-turn-helix domain-containing protein n=1 Tax=Amycolatopsis sp. cg5 TaxID=3238802 RepID=UPI003526A847